MQDLLNQIENIIQPVTIQELNDARFDGECYDKQYDQVRLTTQMKSVFDLMKDGQFRTLSEISKVVKGCETSISAQLRHLKKVRFGEHMLNKRSRGDRENGLWEYQLIVNPEAKTA